MSDYIENKVRKWGDRKCRETNLRLEYLEKKLFSSYKICLPPQPDFWARIQKWIENANGNEDLEKELFNSINEIFYIGPDEFDELFRRAYNGPIARWLIDLYDIDVTNIKTAKEALIEEVKHTLFCPISDSFNINHFYHINNIPGEADIRPEWRTLEMLGDQQQIRNLFNNNQIRNIVLLEDFVGGGSQASDSLIFANNFSDVVSILYVPLIICPEGLVNTEKLSQRLGFLFEPVLPLSVDMFVQKATFHNEPKQMDDLRTLANKTYLTVSNGQAPGARNPVDGRFLKPYYPLGWDQTGGLVVMHTNTPDNTLPMFHFKSVRWEPIFPRHSRNE